MIEPETKKNKETKRNRAYDPVVRWKQIQAMITWAEANMPSHFRRNIPRGPRQKADFRNCSG